MLDSYQAIASQFAEKLNPYQRTAWLPSLSISDPSLVAETSNPYQGTAWLLKLPIRIMPPLGCRNFRFVSGHRFSGAAESGESSRLQPLRNSTGKEMSFSAARLGFTRVFVIMQRGAGGGPRCGRRNPSRLAS
jgi:hypothetical protein